MIEIDVTEFHTYGVDWRPGYLEFTIDGEVVRRVQQSPDYPMQLMIGVFDFPAKAGATEDETVAPELVVAHVRGHSRL
jgi:Glycosyl hydrolases family 16